MLESHKQKQVFLSVGTQYFDEFLSRMDTPEVLKVLKKHGFTKVVFQTGKSDFQPKHAKDYFADVEVFGLRPNSAEYITNSALLIGHCGAGTLLDAIKGNTFAIAVNNENMMHNHQRELLDELKERKHIAGIEHSSLVTADTIDSLITMVEKGELKQLELKETNIFQAIL